MMLWNAMRVKRAEKKSRAPTLDANGDLDKAPAGSTCFLIFDEAKA